MMKHICRCGHEHLCSARLTPSERARKRWSQDAPQDAPAKPRKLPAPGAPSVAQALERKRATAAAAPRKDGLCMHGIERSRCRLLVCQPD